MHAGVTVNWDAIVHAAFSTNFGGTTRVEYQGASVGRVMGVGAGRANIGSGNEMQDLRGAQFGNSAVEIEWVMASLESFGSAEGAMTFGDVVVGHGGGTRRFGLALGWACHTALLPTVAGLRSRS